MWSEQIQIGQIPDYVDSEENVSVCTSQEGSNKPEKERILPPPNPILNHRFGDEGIKTALKVVFKPLPEFQQNTGVEKLGGRHEKFKAKTQKVYKEDDNKNLSEQESEEYHQVEDVDDNSLYSHYYSLKAPQVYKKFDNSNCNSIPYSKKKYFASYFCNIRNIISDQTGKTLMEQNLLKNYPNSSNNANNDNNTLPKQSSSNPNLNPNPEQLNNEVNEDQNQLEQLKTSTTEQSTPKNNNSAKPQVSESKEITPKIQRQNTTSKVGDLKFDSNFESGNLFTAFKINEKEYDLVLQNDINSKGNTQWFFFSVRNMAKNQTVKFNIVNFLKSDSLFNHGMKPVVFSQADNDLNGNSWTRDGFGISYDKSNILREGSNNKYYYKLTYSYLFKYASDTVYFAHCFPYTYSDLQKFTTTLLNNPQRKCFISKKLLCHSIAKNKCEIYTITSSSYFDSAEGQKENESTGSFQELLSPLKRPHQLRDKKKLVFLTARQHPGETPASYMMQGVMEFLTDPMNEQAAFLREHFIFKIVPMLNPDGVIHGNYRCSLSGVDLNRQWSNPSRDLHPTVYFTKNAILKYCTERECRFLCDFHGHSKKMNSFFYGNPNDEDPYLPKIIPMESQNINKGVDFRSCTFKLTADKDSTFRQALLDEMPLNPFIYTFEASFYGTQIQYFKNHFSIDDFKNLGRDVIRGFYRSVKQEVEEELYLYNLQEMKNKKNMPTNVNQQNMEQSSAAVADYKSLLSALIDNQSNSNDADNGSDSNPSEDELSKKELSSLNTSNIRKLTKKLSGTQQQTLLKNESLRLNSRDSNKKQLKTATTVDEKNLTIAFTTAETSSTRVSSSKKIVILYKDEGVQTESNFDFSKLQKFNNQREFFNQMCNNTNKSFQTQYTDEQQNDDDYHENPYDTFQKTESNHFQNKYINQALQHSQGNLVDSSSGVNSQRPRTTNSISGRQNYSGSRNASMSFKPKDQNNSEIKSNLLNNNSSLNETQIFQRRGASFHSTSTGFHSSNIKGQNTSPFKISSYNVPDQRYLLQNIQTSYQNKQTGNRLFVSGVKYDRDNSKQKTNLNETSVSCSYNFNGKSKKNQEVQTQISIPIISNMFSTSSATNSPQKKKGYLQQHQLHHHEQQTQQFEQENVLSDIQNQKYTKISPSPIHNQQIHSQQYMTSYNKNHLNGFSPKKKQYILCIQKKDPNSPIKQAIEKRVVNSPIQQNNLFKNGNVQMGREIIHSPLIKLYKNINDSMVSTGNNNYNSINTSYINSNSHNNNNSFISYNSNNKNNNNNNNHHYNNTTVNTNTLNQSVNLKQNSSSENIKNEKINQQFNATGVDFNKNPMLSQTNTYFFQQTNQSHIHKDNRSNSLNLTGNSSSKQRKQSQNQQASSNTKSNLLNYNSILFTEQASVDYVNNLKMNLQIRQCSPYYQSPIKKGRFIGTAPLSKSRKESKPVNTEPTNQTDYQY